MRRAPSEARAALEDPVPSVDLAAYAAISADIAEGDRPLSEILESRGLSEAQWTEATMFWSRRMGEDVQTDPSGSVSAPTAMAFSEAFVEAQDAKRPVPVLSATEWASLEDAIENAGGGETGETGESLTSVLARRGLRLADYTRLVRYWAKRRGSIPAEARLYEAARASLASRSSEERRPS